jgi:hypothetical protein
MASKPKPSTPPGTNSFGRTYEEQSDFERSQRKAPKDTNPLMDFIGGMFKAPKGKPMAPAMKEKAKKAAVAKKVASKKSVIPASPTK